MCSKFESRGPMAPTEGWRICRPWHAVLIVESAGLFTSGLWALGFGVRSFGLSPVILAFGPDRRAPCVAWQL